MAKKLKRKKSNQAYEEACKVLPGGVSSPVRAFQNVGSSPVFIQKGRGLYLHDIDDNKYIDFVQSWGPLIFGHDDEDIRNSVLKSVYQGLSFGAPTLGETKLANLICDIFNLDKIRFVNSGTEAVMSAIRLARGYTKKDDIIKFKGCYHGHSDGLLVCAGSGASTFSNPSSLGVPKDIAKHTLLANYNDIQSVEKCFQESDNIACVVIEPIAGNMGLVPAENDFLVSLSKLCKKHDTLLIFDEVMSGFRASIKGSLSYTKVIPDIITFGKVIGGGMPVGAFGAKNKIMDLLSPLGGVYQAGTLSGNPITMSAGIASLEKIIKNKNLYTRLDKLAKRLVDGFKKSASLYNIALQVNHRGSMFGFFFCENSVKNYDDALKCDLEMFAKFHNKMLNQGVYLACSQFETSFISSLMNEDIIDEVIQKAQNAFEEISNETK